METGMFKLFGYLMLVLVFPRLLMSATLSNMVCSDMLTEFMSCFSMERSPEFMINEWKWGDINSAFTFDFRSVTLEKKNIGLIFAACPFSSNTNRIPSFFEEFPKITYLKEQDQPYFTFGVQKNRVSGRYALAFVYCGKNSVMYPEVLNLFKLLEPSYKELQLKQPSQYWETTVHDQTCFKYSRIDDQFSHRIALNSQLDWVFCFNRQECVGVMLMRRERMPSDDAMPKDNHSTGTLDLSKFTEEFRWVPDHQIERFNQEIQGRLALKKAGTKMDIDYDRKLIKMLDRYRVNYKDNEEYIQRLGFHSPGSVKTPVCEIFDVPWREFSYYMSTNHHGVVLRSVVDHRGYFNRERFDSFVLDVARMSEGTDILLPNGLDIKPYRHTYPSTNVLYEHVRFDKRSRIIVQPYIAYLYEDNRLIKVLVCTDKNGPPNHGWSLQRKFYCYEGIDEYYWPVPQAYCPLPELRGR